MNILLTGPELCSPWTEGRKLFVRDLAEVMKGEHDVSVLTTRTPGASADFGVPVVASQLPAGAAQLGGLLARLPGALSRSKPDVLLHFPYGTFRGLRGVANDFSLRCVDGIARRAGVRCGTVMYSIDRYRTPRQLATRVSRLIVQAGTEWSGPTYPLGLNTDRWRGHVRPRRRGRTLLFMAGMPNATAERLEYVLKVRGLGQLLQAGKILHPAGVDLIVASPVFGNPDLAQALRRHPLNGWADGALRIAETVTVPAIFDQCDLFVFPYAEPITRFTPTSIVESLLSGVPVVMSDLPFLCELAPQFEAVETFRNGDAGDLAQKVLGLLDAPNRLEELSQRARTAAERHFSIQTSARRLLDLAQGSAAIGS